MHPAKYARANIEVPCYFDCVTAIRAYFALQCWASGMLFLWIAFGPIQCPPRFLDRMSVLAFRLSAMVITYAMWRLTAEILQWKC